MCCTEVQALTRGTAKISGSQGQISGNPQLEAKELLPPISQVYLGVLPKGKRSGVIGLETPEKGGKLLNKMPRKSKRKAEGLTRGQETC